MKQERIDIDFSKPHVMAIINVTPDSFYKNSRTFSESEIESRVEQVVAEGATIIDIGGYSSRPGADNVSAEEEWNRVDRGLEVIRKLAPEIIISIDTFRSQVAENAINKYGYLIINDISAGELDPKIMHVAAKYNVPYIAMHMRGTPKTMQNNLFYSNVVEEVIAYFNEKVNHLKEIGVENIIIDPGFGFAKSLEQNYQLMASLNQLTECNCPILVGISRKSMIYNSLGVDAEQALSGTIALNWEALRQGASIIRVHDVREAADTIKIYNKFLGL